MRPLLQYPSGIAVHFAPLAWIAGEQTEPDLRLAFRPLAASIPAADDAALAAEEEARAAESGDASYGSPYDASGPAPSRSQTTAAAEAAVDEEGTA